MTCTSIALAILAYPDWLTAFGILFVAAAFGASVAVGFYEYRYRVGIDYQQRQKARERLFVDTQ